jgi:hypothetical protein
VALALLPYETTDLPGRQRLVAEAVAVAARSKEVGNAGVDTGVPARVLELEGRWAEARQAARAALDLGAVLHSTTRHALTGLAALARAQGDAPLAWAAVRALVAAPDVTPGNAEVASLIQTV